MMLHLSCATPLLAVGSAVADFSGLAVGIIDGDTIEVLHNQHPERVRLPQSQRHSKERCDPLNRKNGEARILACQHLSCTFVNPHNQTRQPTEHGEYGAQDKHRFHDNLLG
jgi:hypothetical protein